METAPEKPRKNSKAFFSLSTLSGAGSFLGGWQVCHNLCLGIIALLSLLGISVVGMPLLFLTYYAPYFWGFAVVLLIPTAVMYWKNRACMSHNLILFNMGVVIFSVPFLQEAAAVFWGVGGVVMVVALAGFLNKRRKKHGG